jgi:hypothetical protein
MILPTCIFISTFCFFSCLLSEHFVVNNYTNLIFLLSITQNKLNKLEKQNKQESQSIYKYSIQSHL